jgi:integrase-like protein
MLEELQRRNYASGTTRLYLLHVAAFAQHFHRSPDQLGAEEIRRYQLFLIQEKKLARKLVERSQSKEGLNTVDRSLVGYHSLTTAPVSFSGASER